MRRLITEFRERRIWRVLIAYPGAVFVLLQAIEFFINNYGLDGRLLTLGIVVAVGLLPAALLWNWRHGEQGQQEFRKAEVATYVGVGIITFIAALSYWRTTPMPEPEKAADVSGVRTIAVLPFENAGGDAEVQYLCDGIAESLINWLAGVEGVKVVASTISLRLTEEESGNVALASLLGVDSVVRGRLQAVGDQVVVSASLSNTRDETQVWGERLVQPLAEVLFLERSIVAAITSSLSLRIGGDDSSRSASAGTDVPEAYRHYLRGHYLIQATDGDTIQQGLDELRAAIASDPGFGAPYAEIADALSQLVSYGYLEDDGLLAEARNAAYSAVALAPDLPEAHTALATMHQYVTLDWAAAEAAYEAAIVLPPSSPAPFHRYADFLSLTVRLDRARAMAARAIEIDPLDSSSMHSVGIAAMFAGDFVAAAAAMGEWNRFHPESRWSYIKHALTLAFDGQCDASRDKAAQVEALTDGRFSPLANSWLAWGHWLCGRDELYQQKKAAIEAAAAADPDRIDAGMAYLYALEGDAENLAAMAEKVAANRHALTVFLQVFLLDDLRFPVTASLRQNERYHALMRSLGFPESRWANWRQN
jgi:TolB-like protein/tetratricopeptide (TPR) repeat protein